MIVNHAIDFQVFHTDDSEAINDLATVLVREVVPFERDALMDTGHHFALVVPLTCALLRFGEFTLRLRQRLLFFAKEAGILNFFSSRERGEGLEPDIYADLFGTLRQALRLAFNGETHVPFAGTPPLNGAGLDLALDGTMIDHLDRADFREGYTAIMGDTEAALRIGETVVAMLATKAGIAGFLACFHTPKEGFEGQVNTYSDILQDLGVDMFKGGTLLFQYLERVVLLIARKTLALLLIGALALLKQMVIEPATLVKCFTEQSLLFLRRVNSILEHFMHVDILA